MFFIIIQRAREGIESRKQFQMNLKEMLKSETPVKEVFDCNSIIFYNYSDMSTWKRIVHCEVKKNSNLLKLLIALVMEERSL